jgi:hypothetical protein
VVAQTKFNAGNEASLLGFQYKAEGRAPLPCGTIGIVEFTVQPYPMVEGWPVEVKAGFGTPKGGSLFTCPHTKSVVQQLSQTTTAKCGIACTEPVRGYFGSDSKAFMEAVEKNTTAIVNQYAGYQYVDKRHGKGKHHPFQEGSWSKDGPWDEDIWIRSWSTYGGD